MGILIEFFTSLLAKILPFLFSGEEKQTVSTVTGLKDLDRGNLSGTAGLSRRDLPDL